MARRQDPIPNLNEKHFDCEKSAEDQIAAQALSPMV